MSASAASPMWIPTPGGQAFAWYHPPAQGGSRRTAVLLCDPFGWHRMVLHATYRELALRLAEAGFPVLRMDYPGTCDSEGWPRQSARVETWLASLEAALDTLKASSGVAQVALFGALLGGTLAVLLAARRPEVRALALWGSYVHGRTALRTELAAAAAAESNPSGRVPPDAVEGDREALGFLMTAGLIDDLRRIDLLQVQMPGLSSALILPRSGTSADRKLAEHLSAAGAAVEVRMRPREALDTVLHGAGAGYPGSTIEDIAAWLEGRFPELEPASAARAAPLYPPHAVMSTASARMRESALFLGAGVFGIGCEPLDVPAREPAVLLVSAGRNHRAGINRNYTEWARKLAARGHPVLRIDLRGIGDSPASRHARGDALYSAAGCQDVRDAVDWLNARGAAQVVCVGLCAGSYQAFHAALTASTISGLVMLNPLAFHADRANDSDGPTRLEKILRRMRRVARRLGQRLLPRASVFAVAERRIARSFVELTERGVDVCVVYNANEPYLQFVRRALQPVQARLESGGRFQLVTVSDSDHIYSPLSAQAEVTEILMRYIGRLAKSEEQPALAAGLRANVVLQSGVASSF